MVRIKYRYMVCFVAIQASNNPSVARSSCVYPGCRLEDNAAMRLSDGELVTSIRRYLLEAHGSIGSATSISRFRIIHWCPASGLLVLRCLRSASVFVMVALSLITHLDICGHKRTALIDIHHVSGTVRGCQKFLVNFYSRQLYSSTGPEFKTALAMALDQNLISPHPPQITEDL